jgi:DNA-binding FadR family transcriptional regulator
MGLSPETASKCLEGFSSTGNNGSRGLLVPALEAYDLPTMGRLNIGFHDSIVRASGNRRLARLLAEFTEGTMRDQTVTFYGSTDRETRISEHERLVESLEAGNPDAAGAIARRHVERTAEWLLAPFLWPRNSSRS